MTILEALKEANTAAGIRKLSFANIQEFQSFQDSFRFEEWPVNIIVPFTVNGTTNMSTGIRKATVVIQGWVMTRVKENPNDYRTEKMEEAYLNPMRTLAKKFIKRLIETEIIDLEATSIQDTIRPEYMWLNNQTFGVNYQITLPIKDNVC